MYSTAFWCLIVVYFFWALLHNHCYSFHRPKWRLVTSICQGPGPVATRMPFFSPKFKSTANFSAPAQEGNFFFLSGRSAQTKIHNFPIKLSHLFRTSRHVWLSSSACDHCCAYQLICIMTIGTYTTGASTRFFTVQEPSHVSFPPWHPPCRLEVRHKWLDLMGKLWIFFRADLPERKKMQSVGREKGGGAWRHAFDAADPPSRN